MPSSYRLLAVTICFLAASASAQLASDIVPRHRLIPRGEQIRLDLEASRWHLGPFRVQPRLLIRDLGYSDNVFGTPDEPVSDWSATVAAGAHWTLPMGRKVYIVGNVLPEYTYYKKLSERRSFTGTYDASAVALFNHLSLAAMAGTTKTLGVVSSEIEAPVVFRTDQVAVDAEVDIFRRLSVFGHAVTQRPRFESEPTDRGELRRVSTLDRDDNALRAGVRYRFASYLDMAVAAERTRSEFRSTGAERDNESEALLFTVQYNRPRAYLNLTVGNREGTPLAGSTFPGYETTTGSYFAAYTLGAPIELQLNGQQRVVYSLSTDVPYFLETRNGLTAVVHLGNRVAVRGFGEVGRNDYDVLRDAVTHPRVDDVTTYGGGLSFRLYRNISLTVQVSQSEYDSNVNEFDRSVVRVQSLLSVGEFIR